MMPSAPSARPPPSWSAIRRAEPAALERLEREARELARALAVESLASDQDAELDELEERRRYLGTAAWPEEPLAGFRLESSLGAFVLARVAIAWVPAGQMGLRRHPHSPEGLRRALEQNGVEPVVASSVVGDWVGPPEGFSGDVEGLDPGRLAGLAERALTLEERDAALAQVAASGRDLARLAATLVLQQAIRRVLPVLPDDAFGARFATLLALLATGRAEQAARLAPPESVTLRARTIRELTDVWLALDGGETPELDQDPWAPGPPPPPRTPSTSAPEQAPPPPPDEETPPYQGVPVDPAAAAAGLAAPAGLDFEGDDDAEDALEIVEEALAPAVDGPSGMAWTSSEPPEVPAWWPAQPRDREAGWRPARAHAAFAVVEGGVLGLQIAGLDPRGGPIPVDPRLAESDDPADPTERIDLAGLDSAPEVEAALAEPFLPAVRSALRAVLEATKGTAPPNPEASGSLGWLYRRAAALAGVVRGDLTLAAGWVAELPDVEAPERRWIRDLQVRYHGRVPDLPDPGEVRRMAVGLVSDLARALARTLCGYPQSEVSASTEGDDDRWRTSSDG